MLSRLYISNYALIDTLEVDFHAGFTIVTGETGAGKSIIMGALSLLLGERADVRAIRNAEKKSVVEAVFDIKAYNLKSLFEENDLEYDDNECILRRELASNGRTRAFVNDSPVSLATLKEISMRIIDIHSQHSNLLLSRHDYQLRVIDNLAGHADLLAQYADAYHAWRSAEKSLADFRAMAQRNKADEDYVRFQYEQLSALNLHEGEDSELEEEQQRLSNATSIKEALWTAQSLIDGDTDESVLMKLKAAQKQLDSAAKNYREVAAIAEQTENALIELRDVAMTVASLQENLNVDPERLAFIDERLNNIYSLENKHAVSSVAELLAKQTEFEEALSAITNCDDKIAELEMAACETRKTAESLAAKLHSGRVKAAQDFEQAILPLAVDLGMKNLQFKVDFTAVELTATGADEVNYLTAFNKQQTLMPVEATASGGEMSRLMLCIKSIIAKAMSLPTIIFDEVDTGVSGEVASKIGTMMAALAENLQVIAITHLPQVAALGNHHKKVFKTDTDGATLTSITTLTAEQRITEIAAMLSGADVTEAAIANAKSLLKL